MQIWYKQNLAKFLGTGTVLLQCCPGTTVMRRSPPGRSSDERLCGKWGPAILVFPPECYHWPACQLNEAAQASSGRCSGKPSQLTELGNTEFLLSLFLFWLPLSYPLVTNPGVFSVAHLLLTRLFLLNSYQVLGITLDVRNNHIK